MSGELKPCPFCGGIGKIIKFTRCDRKYVVICQNEECMASVGNYSRTRKLAAEAWNRRENDGKID